MPDLSRSCWRKHDYQTSRLAQQQIRRAWRERHIRLWKYRCSSCGRYHLTKSPTAKRKIV